MEQVGEDKEEVVKVTSGKLLLAFLCAQLKSLIEANMEDNGGIFKPWRGVVTDDAAPGTGQYAEECEDPESDDDVPSFATDDALFAAAVAQFKSCTIGAATSGGNDNDPSPEAEPNECLAQIAPSMPAALEKLKSQWRRKRRKIGELQLSKHEAFQAMTVAQQLAEMKSKWRHRRPESDVPRFTEADSESNSDEEYEPEAILDQRLRRNKVEYYVKWLGYQVEESTWEVPANIQSHPAVIRAWEKSQSDKEPDKVPDSKKRKKVSKKGLAGKPKVASQTPKSKASKSAAPKFKSGSKRKEHSKSNNDNNDCYTKSYTARDARQKKRRSS